MAKEAPKRDTSFEDSGNRGSESPKPAPTFSEAAAERRRIAKEAITQSKQQSREQIENATDRLTEFERGLGVIEALPPEKRLDALERERQFMMDDEYQALREAIIDDEYRALAKTLPPESQGRTTTGRQPGHGRREPQPPAGSIEDADDLRLDFEQARDAYISTEAEWLKAKKQHKKRGAKRETGFVSKEMAFERAKREYEQVRAEYARTLHTQKLAFLEERGIAKKDPRYETEISRFRAALLQEVVYDEQDRLAKARVEGFSEEKRTWFRDLLAAYAKRPTYQKVLISTALVSGFVATGGALGLGAGFASGGAAAVFAGQRAIRGMIAGKAAGFVGGMIKTVGGSRVEQWNAKELETLEQNFKVHITKAEKKPDEARTAHEWDLLIHDAIAANDTRIKELTRRHKNVTRWAIAGAVAAGGTTGLLSGAFASEVNAPLGNSRGPLEVPPEMRRAPEYATPEKGPLEVPPEMRRAPEYPATGEPTELPNDMDAGRGTVLRGPLEVPPEMRRAPEYATPGEQTELPNDMDAGRSTIARGSGEPYDDGPDAPLPRPEAPRAQTGPWPEQPEPATPQVEGVPHSPEIHDYTQTSEVEDVPHSPEIHDYPQQSEEGVPHSPEIHDYAQRPEVEDVPHSPEIHDYAQAPEAEDIPHSPELHDYSQESVGEVPHSPEIHDYAQKPEIEDVSHSPEIHDYAQRPEVEPRVRPALGETAAARGDSVWRMLERELASKWGKDFTELRQGERDYIVDALKDRIAEHPERYGMAGVKDINKIQIGQRLDLAGFSPEELQEISDQARGLKSSAIEHIEQARKTPAVASQETVASRPPETPAPPERVISLADTDTDEPDRVLSLNDTEEDIENAKATPAQIEANIQQNVSRWHEMGIREKNLQALEGISRNARPMTVDAFLKQVAENPDERWENYKYAPEAMNLPGTGIFKALTHADYKSYSALAEDLREIIKTHPEERQEILKMTIPDIARHYEPGTRKFVP